MSSISTRQIAFPTFDEETLECVAELADAVNFAPGDVLIRQGQKDYPFYLITAGEVRIVEKIGEHENHVITHGAGHFTGDVDMLTGRAAVITAIANTPGRAYRMCAKRLRMLLGECPTISDILLEAFQLRRKLLEGSEFVGVRMIGAVGTRETARMQEFFYKNHVPYTFHEAQSADGQEQLACLDAAELPLPVVHCNGHTVGNPSLPKLAECIGISRNVDQQVFDLVIVGSGPAGLAAAVYAASEGIKTLVIDSVGPGGQAASSAKIENFMGFPSGLSGTELANRGYLQALKFGAQFIAPITVKSIETCPEGLHHVHLCTGQTAHARCVLVASGVSYRQLDMPGCREFENAGVYYAATTVEARLCDNATAVVVGGGNSAGQAAMFLANTAREVKLVIRGDDLAKSMSAYLCHRVEQHDKIKVLKHSEVTRIWGSDVVEEVEITNSQTGEATHLNCAGVFIFVGARPHTDWLPPEVLLDSKGFVITGANFPANSNWPLDRSPCELETTVPGIMAAGDVRAGTTKRCGFAVGDGSLAVACLHKYLSGL